MDTRPDRSFPESRQPRVPNGLLARVPSPFLGSPAFLARVGVLGVLALAVFAVLGLRLWSLELLQRGHLLRTAEQQATRPVELPAARGAIVDAEGRLLVGSTGETFVAAQPEVLGSTVDGVWRPSRNGGKLLAKVAELARVKPSELVTRIREDVVQSPYAPAILLPASEPLASYLDERALAFPGISVDSLPVRSYPHGGLGGEFLGQLGQLSAAEVKSKTYPWAEPGELVGQSGVEAAYDQVLNGGFSVGRVRVNALGRQLGPIQATGDSRDPGTLQLTIDLRLQQAAERAVADGVKDAHLAGYPDADGGAAIVMNAQTGAIEALVSSPELNEQALDQDPSYYGSLLKDSASSSPLVNRATQGLYPIGSTFKPIVAEAALSAGLITPTSTLPCTGSLTVGGRVFHNVESWIDAELTLPQALEISCDTWFYQLGEDFYGRQLGGQLDMQRWAGLFGLGHDTGLDIPGESSGVVPTPSWLKQSFGLDWYEGDSVNLSIGQGYLDVTPLQLAVAYAALANGGTVVRPHVGAAVIRNGVRTPIAAPPVRTLKLTGLAAIRQGLYLAAHGPSGTSTGVFGNYPIAVDGKTGTAETGNGSDDSWYASFAPAGHPKIVVVVVVEHGGFGVDAAAPAAQQIYDAYFHVRPPA